MQNHKNTDT